MPRIPQKLRKRAIGMFNAGIMMNAVAMYIGYSTRPVRHLRQRFEATGLTEDRPCSGRLCVSKRYQDRYIRNMHLGNRFQTATATAANTNGIHNNRKPAQTVRNRLREGGLGARRPHLRCVFARRHGINRVNWARTHQHLVRQQWNYVLFSDESRFTIHRGDDRVREKEKLFVTSNFPFAS